MSAISVHQSAPDQLKPNWPDSASKQLARNAKQAQPADAGQPAKPAEQRAIAAMGLTEFATTLANPQVIRRTTKPQKN